MTGDPGTQQDSTKAQTGAATPQGLTPGSPPWDSSSRVQLKPSSAATLPHEPMGFYTDTTVCIGCKACEVACKEWNQLPATGGGKHEMSGDSYDNTRKLDGIHWRHVKFVEQFSEDRTDGRWLMMSDVCKHCVNAPCLEVCPTGAIIRTEFDTVVIQSDTCNGCRACIGACPFGVIGINDVSNVAQKCTLCYDRLQAGMEPACSQACPTESIRFGPIRELKQKAQERVEQLHGQGESRAYLYGADDKFLGGLNSFYLLVDKPGVYGLPVAPKMPTRNLIPSSLLSTAGAVALALLGMVGLRKRRMDDPSLRSEQGEEGTHV
jgi:formate dehydrogenase iron-sulfur subunit